MLELAGYQIVELIGTNGEMSLYRLVREGDGLPLLAKTSSVRYAGSELVAAFQYEYDTLMKLKGKPAAVEPFSLEIADGQPVLLLHDPGWMTLEQWLLTRRASLSLPELLTAAIAMAEGLHHIHKEQITLNQLTPLFMVVSDDITQMRYLDLGLNASTQGAIPSGAPGVQSDKVLPYLSPEQTGRAGRVPDFRSDFYSLGTILYEWFTHTLPFQVGDALDLVHQHLAGTPDPVHMRNPSIPQIISDIVMKCLGKMPETRYASAYGIKSDLEECLIQLQHSEAIQWFPLAQHDIRWIDSDSLIGRKAELVGLGQALRRVSEGASEIVCIRGRAGVGKTALVREALRNHNAIERIIVSAGSSKSVANQQPYSLWVQVVEQLVAHLLTLNATRVEEWKAKILDAVQGDGQLLIEQVPRLAFLIGKQSELEDLPTEERLIRFRHVLSSFLQLFMVRELSAVLFVDDMQWTDEVSIQYLYELLSNKNTERVLIICAYRDEETESLHLLKQVMGQLKQIGKPVHDIYLSEFDQASLQEMLSPILQGHNNPTDELVQVMNYKTGGNPADIIQFLQQLRNHNLLSFDEEKRTWRWDVKRIAEMDVPEHMADSIDGALKQLPETVGYLLGRAAIIGKQFDLDTLVYLSGLSQDQVWEGVQYATANRLLQPIHEPHTSYAFQHDRIWKASLESVSVEERTSLHMQLGWMLAERLQAGEAVTLDRVLSHLNQARERIVDQGRNQELAELNLQAGFMAKEAAAFEATLAYFRMATDLLADEGWENCYSLTHQAHVERAEAEFRNTNFFTALEILELLMEKSKTDLEKAQACLLMIRLETNSDRFHEVIALGEKALGYLGIVHRANPSKQQVLRQFIKLRWKLRKHSVESIGELPPMTDVRYQTAMFVLDYVSQASFVLDKTGWLSKTLLMIELTLKHGMTAEASIGFIGYSMVLNFNLRRYEEAYKWGKLAYQISKANPRLYAVTVATFSLCSDSWRQYEPSFLPISADQAVKEALNAGEYWHANQTLLVCCAMLFHFSHPLKDIYIRLIEQAPYLERNGNIVHQKEAAILTHFLSDLMGYPASTAPFSETDIVSELFLQELSEDNRYFLQAFIYIYQILAGYLLGRYEEAYDALEKSLRQYMSKKDIAVDPSIYHYYRVLVLKERIETAGTRQQVEYVQQIRMSARVLKRMARRSHERYWHKYLLAMAEVAKFGLQDRKAERLYGQALEAAHAHGHIHDAAIIAECYGQYGLLRKKYWLAKFYLNEAYESYLTWGALAKTKLMEARYGHVIQVMHTTEPDMERVDYLSVMNSAQALSGEMQMDKLSRMLLRIMLQNAGAEYGALIYPSDNGWSVEAYGTAEEQHIKSIPLEDAKHLVPAAIVEYTARTNEAVILHDAAASSMFGRNDYIKRKSIKAVLCLPIVYQNKLICQIYMENNLTSGVFEEKRLDVLKLLSSQCAISIANAKLYMGMQNLKNSLEEQVEQRTRALEKSMQATSEALAETTVYAERNRIAQEIHDIVGHTLTSTVLQIEAGKRLLSKDMDDATKRLNEAQDLVRHSLNEIRNSVHMLKEDKYYDLELALRKLMQDTERNTGVVIHHTIASISHLSFMHKKVIYHALQEGLTNGIRHGGSSQFYFSLQDDGAQVVFSLSDNGSGSEQIKMGFGLNMMKDRVQQLGGTLAIASSQNEGCSLRIELPYSI